MADARRLPHPQPSCSRPSLSGEKKTTPWTIVPGLTITRSAHLHLWFLVFGSSGGVEGVGCWRTRPVLWTHGEQLAGRPCRRVRWMSCLVNRKAACRRRAPWAGSRTAQSGMSVPSCSGARPCTLAGEGRVEVRRAGWRRERHGDGSSLNEAGPVVGDGHRCRIGRWARRQ